MSQADLAKAVGVSQQNLSQLENSVLKGSRKIGKIATVLGCSISDLDPDFIIPSGSLNSGPLTDGAATLISSVAARMAIELGFIPTDVQVVQHLIAKTPYHDLLD